MKRILILALVVSSAAWLPVIAQEVDRLAIRVVTAGEGRQAKDPDLKDVLALLKETLRFSSFEVVGKSNIPVADGATTALAKGYDLSLSNVDRKRHAMTVTVTKGRKKEKLLETRLKLRPKRPVIVGGFDDAQGTKTIIILNLE